MRSRRRGKIMPATVAEKSSGQILAAAPAAANGADTAAMQKRVDELFDSMQANRYNVGRTTAKERIQKLKKLLKVIESNREAIHQALYADFKKPSAETDLSEIYVATSEIKHAIAHLKQWMKPRPVDPNMAFLTTRAELQYEPKGVCLIIAPWNFPFNLTFGPLISAVAAGNCAIIKPSEFTPATSKLTAELLAQVFPENEIAVVQGAVEASQALLAKPFDHIFFTGSPKVGKIIMKAAAEHLATVTLELGGKSPVIVDETANLNDAAKKVAWGKFMNNGQTCIAPDYVMVHQKNYDKFMDLLKKNIQSSYGESEDARKASPDYARIISKGHQIRLREMVEDAVSNGAKVEIGGEFDEDDRYVAPTVLSNAGPGTRVMKEEIFGPVLPVLPYANLNEAVDLVNSKEKPLALYMFSGSGKNIDHVMTETSAGGSCVNEVLLQFLHPNLPFGGINNSGHGNSHGWFGFKAFSHERAVLKHNTLAPLKLMYPPYTPKVKKLIQLLLKFF